MAAGRAGGAQHAGAGIWRDGGDWLPVLLLLRRRRRQANHH